MAHLCVPLGGGREEAAVAPFSAGTGLSLTNCVRKAERKASGSGHGVPQRANPAIYLHSQKWHWPLPSGPTLVQLYHGNIGSITPKRVLASLCPLVPIPAGSAHLLREIHGQYFSWSNSSMLVPWLCPSPAQEMAKRCSSLARGLWHAMVFSRCPVPLCARAGRPRGSAPSKGDLLTAPGSPENVELVLSGAMKCGRTPFFFFLQWKSLKS